MRAARERDLVHEPVEEQLDQLVGRGGVDARLDADARVGVGEAVGTSESGGGCGGEHGGDLGT